MTKAIRKTNRPHNKGDEIQKSTQKISTGNATYTANNTKLFPYSGSKAKYTSIFDKAHAKKMKQVKVYIEAFSGTLASLFHNLKHVKADKYIINDFNPRLVNLYKQIAKNPLAVFEKYMALENEYQRIIPSHLKGQRLIDKKDRQDFIANQQFFYEARKFFNSTKLDENNAALFIFLFNHNFRGMYSENKKGECTVSFNWSSVKINTGSIKEAILNLHAFFNENDVVFENMDAFELIAKYNDEKDTFIYLDPPYSDSSVQYTKKGINDFDCIETHYKMLELCNKYFKHVMYSNHHDDSFIKLFDSYENFSRTNNVSTKKSSKSKLEILALKTNIQEVVFKPIEELLNIGLDHKDIQAANNIEEIITPSKKEPTNDSVLRVGTAFSGIGAPEQALKEMGFNIKNEFMVEIDKFARQTYLANHKVNKVYEDITKINPKELPDIDLFVFGSPCQSFSLAGKRGGFEDTRGTLIFNGLEIIKEKQPKYFIYENVKGMLSHDGGKTFDTVLNAFAELGYDFQHKVLNTKDFGLPQNRERIFIVGTRKDLQQKFTFPTPQGSKSTINDFIKKDSNLKYKTYAQKGAVPHKAKTNRSVLNVIYKLPHLKYNADQRICSTDGISPCLTASGTKAKFFDTKNQVFRYLSIEEMAQIQGFRNFKFPVSDSQAKKQLGNSMSVNVIQALYKSLLTAYLPSTISEEETEVLAA